ncbi:type IV secretory system conjugative DNA transfer family protein [Brevibacillus reuszeri]|uniref:type IV secretory system conjugative DNA transfer family protein n=1 Tax=Brevibacillus reuszeri TaxID=54915 RepID=UPI000CCC6B89|nr:type IV secretory system conjugative DNA transfer family protein [Brevibacillus reuszeri]
MSKITSQVPIILRARKRVEDIVQKVGIEKVIRAIPLLITVLLTFITVCSIIGSILQVMVIWYYPPEMWSKTVVLENVKAGPWKSLFTLAYFNPQDIGFFSFLYVGILGLSTWLFSTKVKQLKKLPFRYIMFGFCILVIFAKWVSWSSLPVKEMFTPWIAELMVQYVGKTETMDKFLEDNVVWFTWGLLILPIYAVYFFLAWFIGVLMQHSKRWHEWFANYEFNHHLLQGITEMQRAGKYADICIGIYVDAFFKVKAIMRGIDRATHTIIVGSIGTGKSAAALLPVIRLDMKHLVNYINNFQTDDDKTLSQRLSGLTIIDPSNDLCSKSFQLARAHGIPKEAIYYLDPENQDSKSYNPLRGPAETVAATFVFVLEGLQPDQEDFYKNTQAVHLYYHILLVKLFHDAREEIESIIRTYAPTYPDIADPTKGKPYLTYQQVFGNNACTLDTLMKMYRDPWLVKQAAYSLQLLLPEDWENQFDGDDLSYYSIIEQTSSFIHKIVVPKANFRGEVNKYLPDSPHAGEIELEDKYAEKITGLTNVLNQMSSNTYFRRVMFGDSGLDLDVLLRTGGVLLINTADGIMGKLSGYFAQIMLQSMVQAVYRRDISKGQPHGHHIVVDEFPKYAYESYPDFPANARKYGGFVTIGMQTMAQMESRFSKAYLETIIGVHRNRMVYQGVPLLDAEYFSKYFGTKEIYQLQEGRTFSSAYQDSPGMSEKEGYALVEVPRFAPHEISQSKKFEAVLQLNIDNEQQTARRVKADFVPRKEFKNAKEKPDSQALSAWVERIHYEAAQGPVTKGKYVCGLIDQDAEDFKAGKDLEQVHSTEDHSAPLLERQTNRETRVVQRETRQAPEPGRGSQKPPMVPRRETTSAQPFDFSMPTAPPVKERIEQDVDTNEHDDSLLPILRLEGTPIYEEFIKTTQSVTQTEQENKEPEIPVFLEGEEIKQHNLHEVDRKKIHVQELRNQRNSITPRVQRTLNPRENKREVDIKPGRVMGSRVTNNVIKHEANRSNPLDIRPPVMPRKEREDKPPTMAPTVSPPDGNGSKHEDQPSVQNHNPYENVDLSNLMPAPSPQKNNQNQSAAQSHPIRQQRSQHPDKVLQAENFKEAPVPADKDELLKTFVADALEHKNKNRRRSIGGEDE